MTTTVEKSPETATPPAAQPWRMPHYRIGAILHASKDEEGLEELSLGVDRARRVSDRMLSGARYLDYTDKLYQAVANKLKLGYRKKQEAPVLSYGPGHIIDFPRFWLGSDKSGWIEARVCMTVCLYESQSKIWIRFVGHRDSFDQRQATTVLPRFLDDTETIAGNLINGLVPLYRADMQEATESPSVDVGIKHIVEFISVDTDAEDLDDYADIVRFASLRTALSAPGQSAEEFRQVLDIVSRDYFEKPRKPEFLVQHTTSRGRTGVFGQYYDGPRVIFIGLGGLSPEEEEERVKQASAARADQPELDRRLSGSLQVTAELANEFARDF